MSLQNYQGENRRLKRVMIHPQEVLNLFAFPGMSEPEYYSQVKFLNLPEGYHVIGVHYDPCYQAMVFVLYHKEWPVIRMDEYPPVIDTKIQTYKITKLYPDYKVEKCN